MRPGTRFHAGAIRPAGHIFYIPGSERPTDDPKSRPHFLVNRCDVASDSSVVVATLAHMSTKATEHSEYGSPLHEIVGPNALTLPDQAGNYVIAARLFPRNPERLMVSAMSATDHVRSVRGAVLRAVGMGEGVAATGTASVRGRLARVGDRRVGIRYGCVVTGHAYSASRRYQVIVPIIDRVVHQHDGPQILEPNRWSVVPMRQPWWNALPLQSPMLDTAGLISLSEAWTQSRDWRRWLKPQIEVLPTSIDPGTLAAVEAKISERLSQ
jgi:hypothetical protein